MSIARTPIESDKLSDAVTKAMQGPAKIMAAKGMAPFSDPADILTALYQLAHDEDGKIATSAKKSAKDLPEVVLQGALSVATLDARVLDYFADQVRNRSAMVQLVVVNRATDDSTIARIATNADEETGELIAENQQRILRHPEIIAALYGNPKVRMSTANKLVELAVRNDINVPGVAAWEEISKALSGDEEEEEQSTLDDAAVDAMFTNVAKNVAKEAVDHVGGEIVEVGEQDAAAGADNGAKEDAEEENLEDIPLSKMTVPMKLRLAAMGNAFVRSQLVRDAKKIVAMAVIKSPQVSDNEVTKYASNSALCDEVITYIANKREWTKLYSVKKALVMNPKTPMPIAMRMMTHLRDRDIKAVARSKGIPSALAAQAKQLSRTRGRG